MRKVDIVKCSCGGSVEEIETTDEEERDYGCGRRGCCVEVYVCNKCGTRFTFSLEAPEME